MELIELFKALLIGIVEGITEWLPISSTGHLILFDEFVRMNVSTGFFELFKVVIQLGAIMAVIILYFHRLNPFSPRKVAAERAATLNLWAKVIVASIPAAIIGVFLDDWVEKRFSGVIVVACALIVYGIAFIVIERVKGEQKSARRPKVDTDGFEHLSFLRALAIGLFQCLAIVPGTSRSGSTILGGLILGVSRKVAAEFSFFLAIPIMFGWSLLKVVKGFVLDGLTLSTTEWGVFGVGIVVAFIVSVLAIKFLMGYIKNHSFEVFGWYRIVLGVLVLTYFAVTGALFV